MSKKSKSTVSPPGSVRQIKYTKEQIGRGLIEIVGLLIILGLCILLFVKLAPQSAKSGIREVSVTVVHADGTENPYTVTSQKDTLGEALTDGKLMEDGALDGESGDWLCSKNGASPTADWESMELKTGDAYIFTLS